MRNYLRRWSLILSSLFYVLWLYLSTGFRFIRWRIHLSRRRFDLTESTQSMKQTLLLIRHGQTTWNVEQRLPGQLPGVALTDTGKQQAERLAEALAVLPISIIISSPLERALDTAEYLREARDGLTIHLEPDLKDTDVGRWSGKIIGQVAKDDPAWKAYVHDPTVAPEGVETFPQVQQRAVAAVERWRKREGSGAYPAFVAHADVIKLLVAHYSGLEAGRAGTLLIDNASVSLIEIEDEQKPHIIAIGWSPRPGWLKPPVPNVPKKDEEQRALNEQEQKP